MHRVRLVAIAAALAATACSSEDPQAAPLPTTTPLVQASAPAPSSPPPCPTPKSAPVAWPSPVPPDFPKLQGAILGSTNRTPEGLTIVRFRTAASLRQGVLFAVQALPKAGFALGRGDAEANQADLPFTRATVTGLLRGNAVQACATEWLLAVTRTKSRGTGNPLLPPPPGVTPSPLPFGNG